MNFTRFLIIVILTHAIAAQEFSNPGCSDYDQLRNCLKCQDRFYLSAISKICYPVNPFCKEYSQEDGKCTSCYQNFVLIETGECRSVSFLND